MQQDMHGWALLNYGQWVTPRRVYTILLCYGKDMSGGAGMRITLKVLLQERNATRRVYARPSSNHYEVSPTGTWIPGRTPTASHDNSILGRCLANAGGWQKHHSLFHIVSIAQTIAIRRLVGLGTQTPLGRKLPWSCDDSLLAI